MMFPDVSPTFLVSFSAQMSLYIELNKLATFWTRTAHLIHRCSFCNNCISNIITVYDTQRCFNLYFDRFQFVNLNFYLF